MFAVFIVLETTGACEAPVVLLGSFVLACGGALLVSSHLWLWTINRNAEGTHQTQAFLPSHYLPKNHLHSGPVSNGVAAAVPRKFVNCVNCKFEILWHLSYQHMKVETDANRLQAGSYQWFM